MSLQRVLITPRSITAKGHPALSAFERAGMEPVFCTPGEMPGEDELCELLPGCTGYLAGVERISERVLAAADALRAISRNGVGVDAIDLAAAERRGVKVLTAPGANAQGVAELAVGLMFAGARHIVSGDRALKAGGWQRTRGFELSGRTVGVVGAGNIGRRVLAMARCLGMETVVHDPVARRAVEEAGFEWVELAELAERSHVVTLHAPPQEAPLVDAELLSRMRRGVVLINTARAGLVDSEAVLASLREGIVGVYATDVYEREPPEHRDLVEHPDVIATAHIGGYTEESVDRATGAAVTNLIQALQGES